MKSNKLIAFFCIILMSPHGFSQQTFNDPVTVSQAICILDGFQYAMDKSKKKLIETNKWDQAEQAMLDAIYEFNVSRKDPTKKIVLVTTGWAVGAVGILTLLVHTNIKKIFTFSYLTPSISGIAEKTIAERTAHLVATANEQKVALYGSWLVEGHEPAQTIHIDDAIKLTRRAAEIAKKEDIVQKIDIYKSIYGEASEYLKILNEHIKDKITETPIEEYPVTQGNRNYYLSSSKYAQEIDDWILKKENLPYIKSAIREFHSPAFLNQVEQTVSTTAAKFTNRSGWPKAKYIAGWSFAIAGTLFAIVYGIYGDKVKKENSLIETDFTKFDKHQFREFLATRPDLVRQVIQQDIFECYEYARKKHAHQTTNLD